jgi:hypothetical protein
MVSVPTDFVVKRLRTASVGTKLATAQTLVLRVLDELATCHNIGFKEDAAHFCHRGLLTDYDLDTRVCLWEDLTPASGPAANPTSVTDISKKRKAVGETDSS